MIFIAGILTVLLVLDSALLILLVLIQLPKKDAGIGLAFGSGAADALFGAGSGNALTKVTKYATGIFFVLSLLLGFAEQRLHAPTTSAFQRALQQQQEQQPAAPGQVQTMAVPTNVPGAPAPVAPPASAGTNAPPK
ncbi:MAG: preprotein translocase subunit SecG [Verrucomicrobia bacterium]|nr:preprotein translocase subunit SecG [Verrucomicrobiota bacterium]MDE3097956.1 preprotein translocase subunit SecG [Verrucomicrobiota bacterium]